MNYEPLAEAATLGESWALWIFSILAIIGLVFALVQLASEAPSKKLKIRAITGMSIGVISIVAMLVSFHNFGVERDETEKQNYHAATENLKTKYDIKEVNWGAKETTAEPLSTSGNGEITIEANDGRLYIFKYRADLASGEPFLKDMPIPGGSVPEQAVTADSLLK